MARKEAWTYVSGVVAVEETQLLTAGELEDLARHDTILSLEQDLRQREAYQGLAGASDQDGWRAGLEAVFVRRVRDLARYCPEPAAAEVFLLHYDYQRLRQYAQRQVERPAGVPPRFARWTDDEVQRGWERTYDSAAEIARVAEELSAALARGGAEPGRIVDLVLDRCELGSFQARAALLRSRFIDDWTRQSVLLRAALAVARARMAQDVPADVLKRFLVTGTLADEWLVRLADGPTSELVGALAERVESPIEDGTLERLAVDIDDWLTERMQGAKYVAFGPERVFGYTWGLFVENVNLRLIGQAAELGLPPEPARARERRSYV